MIQNESWRIKGGFFFFLQNRKLLSCGTILGDLLYNNWSSQRGKGEGENIFHVTMVKNFLIWWKI